MKERGLRVVLAEKDVVSGVQHVRSLLSVRSDGLPRLLVAPWLTQWHREQIEYKYPEGKEEPVGDGGDHLMDATRYLTYTHSVKYVPFEYVGGLHRSRYEGESFSGGLA
jgi:hypothetical protein